MAILLSVLGAALPMARAEQRLSPFDAASPAALLQAYSGRPFVLVFWSVNCAPCLVEMAQWRTYRRAYPGIPIVHVATESLEQSADIVAILDRYDPGGAGHRAFADDFSERIRYAVDPAWRGETPKVYFFDRKHDRVAHTGTLDPEWTRRWFERQAASLR